MNVDRARIAQLVPQAGSMCLLHEVTQWDASSITCSAAAAAAGHPLSREGALPAIAGCEYAAQATAVHGALVDGADSRRAGMLAKLMDVHLHRSSFAQDGIALNVRAELLGRIETGCLYAFEVAQDGQPVVSGRLIVALAAPVPA